MKRTELKRKTPLRSKVAGLLEKVRAPLKKRNAKRQARRRADDDVYGSYFRYVKSLPCSVRGEGQCFGEVTGHHLKTVGSGGKDAGNLVPLCYGHHREIHDFGAQAFDAKYFNSLPLHAKTLWADYQAGMEAES